MSFRKIVLPLSIAGLVAGLAVSLLVTPRYTATAVLAVRDKTSDAGTREIHRKIVELRGDSIAKVKSDEGLSRIIQDSGTELYKEERAHMPIKEVVAIARDAIQITPEDTGARNFSAIRLKTTYRNARGADRLASAVVSRLISDQYARVRDLSVVQSEERDRAFRGRIQQLRTRLDALEAHSGIPPNNGEKADIVVPSLWTGDIKVLDAPAAKLEYPNRMAFTLAGGVLGFLLAIPISRRNRYH